MKVADAGPPAGILEMDYQETPEKIAWEAKAAEAKEAAY